jgi:hypothetical protein
MRSREKGEGGGIRARHQRDVHRVDVFGRERVARIARQVEQIGKVEPDLVFARVDASRVGNGLVDARHAKHASIGIGGFVRESNRVAGAQLSRLRQLPRNQDRGWFRRLGEDAGCAQQHSCDDDAHTHRTIIASPGRAGG